MQSGSTMVLMVEIYSSGWPTNVKTEEEKREFCRRYKEKEHIHLDDWSRFVKNPGKRAVAKLMLNSLVVQSANQRLCSRIDELTRVHSMKCHEKALLVNRIIELKAVVAQLKSENTTMEELPLGKVCTEGGPTSK
ncbi:hypothetical protein CAEBREN_10222 [Caenorhabditis brenneri]|uniref:Uncharacterized protein n=1 Tax=Caenorhabditis brenneri TaxID=135651 RepID=G0NDW3_CAEBE|nr:hypothetical protein CAEBREN_10222 [Caenorhabditis brenneri]